jgi:hypothetical protein
MTHGWKHRLSKFSAASANLGKRLGVFAVAGTIIGYWISFEDRIADRHERAWSVVRLAQLASGGNVGQVSAIQTLTRDCDRWWNRTPLVHVLGYFFQDCVSLKSLSLKLMDFRGLQAAGATFPDSSFSCSNFGNANLRNSDLSHVRFNAADLQAADFSGANLTHTCLAKANIAGARFSKSTTVDVNTITKACILKEEGQAFRKEIVGDHPDLQKMTALIPDCDSPYRCPPGAKDSDCTN